MSKKTIEINAPELSFRYDKPEKERMSSEDRADIIVILILMVTLLVPFCIFGAFAIINILN